ncbi:MAG: hypothetical protein D6690_16040 [Nitrospirae bacterium]|nr:MAG: hypothetical protein D6690_16040 [Nitrospirota bacterium]
MGASFLKTPQGAAFLSALCPGLGLFIRGYSAQAWSTLLLGLPLVSLAVILGQSHGIETGIFFGILVVLPWWVFQVFHSSLAHPNGLRATWHLVWERGLDIRYLGGLFILSALMDLSIIVANPSYNLHVFCARPTGVLGLFVKAQSPTFHMLIGYGFLRQARWGLLIYLLYASYGFLNAMTNFACEGYGRIRTIFLLTLATFTIYIWSRRRSFRSASPEPRSF